MEQSAQTAGTTFTVKIAGPYFDRNLGKWRLRLLGTGGEQYVTELDRTGRALNQHFGRQAVVKGIEINGSGGEKLLEILSYDVPRLRKALPPEESAPSEFEGLSWDSDEPVEEDEEDLEEIA